MEKLTFEESQWNTLIHKHAKLVKSGKGFKYKPATVKEIEQIAKSKGLEITDDTTKGELIAFLLG